MKDTNNVQRGLMTVFAVVLFLLSPIQVHAQEPATSSLPTISSETRVLWKCVGYDEKEGFVIINVQHLHDSQYSPNPDVPINGKPYRTVQVYYHNNPEKQSFLFRHDDSSLYLLDEESGDEHKVFDYSLKVGDIFTRIDGTRLQVIEITEMNIFEEYSGTWKTRKKLELCGVEDAGIKDTWVEGMGSLITGLIPDGLIKGVRQLHLCSWNYEIPPKTLEDWPQIYVYDCQWSDDNSFSRLYHFNEKIEDEERQDEIHAEFEGDVLHLKGYLRINCVAKLYVLFTKHEREIRIFTYEPGGEAMTCSSFYRIDLSFPGFSPGPYKIQFSGFPELEAVCLPAEGLQPIIDSEIEAPVQYDLTGRRISDTSVPSAPSVLPKGVYIQGGKKVMVK